MTANKRPQVVIVGAGFGGLWAARTIDTSRADITIIDHNNYHTFLPLLYQVSAAELEPEEIAYPIRAILRKVRHSDFILADVKGIDFSKRLVETDGVKIPYDYLILATGSTSFYFGVPGAEENAFSLKTLEEGTILRNHILCNFEQAVHEADSGRKERLLTFVVVGGGATGVEFAGALAELIYGPLERDYPTLDFGQVRVILLEAADNLLMHMPEKLRRYSLERLSGMGVDIRLGAVVGKIEKSAVHLKDGSIIETDTVVWTAGVRGDPLAERLGLPVSRNGRVKVMPTLQVPEHRNVYVVGDLAYFEEDGEQLPLVAPVAIQQGTVAANNIVRQIGGREPEPFEYKDRGTMVTIGRNAGVARLPGRSYTGLFAWILWLAVHLLNLIGFRNRILVMINWSQDYFLFERAVRFIFPSGAYSKIKALQCASKPETGERKEKKEFG